MRFLFSSLLLLAMSLAAAAPLRADVCPGHDLLAEMPAPERAALETRAAATPFASGLFWRATKDDSTLTIFGTFHYAHPMTEAHLAALLPHARAADFSFFEMGYDDMRAFKKRSASDPSVLFLTSGPTLPDLMDEADWQRLRTRLGELGIPSFMAAKFKPAFLSMIIGLSPCVMGLQARGEKGIDERLSTALHDAGRETRSIEDVNTVLRMFDSYSMEEQIAMLNLTLDVPLDRDDLHQTMLALYLRGDLALLWEYARQMSLDYGGPNAARDFARMEKSLLTDRNRAWAEKLAQEAPGHDLFIAVGGGHLPGENGLLNLLAGQGYAIAPLALDP